MTTQRTTIALASAVLFLVASCGSETTPTETATDTSGAPSSSAPASSAPASDSAAQSNDASDNQLGSFAADGDETASTTTAPSGTVPATVAESTTTEPPAEPSTTVGGQLDVFSLQVGDCVFDSPESEVETLDAISCSEDHDLEVYALFDLPDGDFPGNAEVDIAAENGCLERFDAYVGIAYAESVYGFTYLTPLEDGWNNLGDREVVCLLGRIDGEPNIGSAENAGI